MRNVRRPLAKYTTDIKDMQRPHMVYMCSLISDGPGRLCHELYSGVECVTTLTECKNGRQQIILLSFC